MCWSSLFFALTLFFTLETLMLIKIGDGSAILLAVMSSMLLFIALDMKDKQK